MKSMKDEYVLKRAGDYTNPRYTSQALPVVYGDLTQADEGGLWRAVCIDTDNCVYALAGTSILSLADGNIVTLFDNDGNELTEFTFNHSNNYEGKGNIATAAFSEDQRDKEPITVLAKGRSDANGLLQNPMDIMQDYLVNLCCVESSELNSASFAHVRSRLQAKGLTAGGIIESDRPMGETLSEILGCFLGSWWRDSNGLISVSVDMGAQALSESNVVANIPSRDSVEASVEADLKNLCNRARVAYAYNWASYKYESQNDGAGSQNNRSAGVYEVQSRLFEWPWVRNGSVVEVLQSELVDRFANPTRLITLSVANLNNLQAEKGEYAWFSSRWLRDPSGQPMVNQLMRILSLESDLNNKTAKLILMDTGYYKTICFLADGGTETVPRLADGTHLAGVQRDRQEV